MLSTRAWRTVAVLSATVLFVLVLVSVYMMHLRSSAKALIQSAYEIAPNSDMENLAQQWQRQFGNDFYSTSSSYKNSRTYQVILTNKVAHALHLVPFTFLSAAITTVGSAPKVLVVSMYVDDKSTVWVQEDFSLQMQVFRVQTQRDRLMNPSKTTVDLSITASHDDRKAAFGLNVDCMIKIGGCDGPQQLLPTIRQ